MMPLRLYFESSVASAAGGVATSIGRCVGNCGSTGAVDFAAGAGAAVATGGLSLNCRHTDAALLARNTMAMMATMATQPINAGRRKCLASLDSWTDGAVRCGTASCTMGMTGATATGV